MAEFSNSNALEGGDNAKRYIFQINADKEVHINIERDFITTDQVGILINTKERATINVKRDMIIGASASRYLEKPKVHLEQGLENSDRNAEELHAMPLQKPPGIKPGPSIDCSEGSQDSHDSLVCYRQMKTGGLSDSQAVANNEKESDSEDQEHDNFTLVDPNFPLDTDKVAEIDDVGRAESESGYYSRPGEFYPLSQIMKAENHGNRADHWSLEMHSKMFHEALQEVHDLHTSGLIHGDIHAGNILTDGRSIKLQNPGNYLLRGPAGIEYRMLRDDVLQMARCLFALDQGITFENIKEFEEYWREKICNMNVAPSDDMTVNAGIQVMKYVLDVYTVCDERRLLTKLLTM